jgi:hypothetical protein
MIPQLKQSEIAVGLTLADLHEKMVAFGEDQFARKGAAPFLWLIWDGAHLLWIDTPWEDEEEKYLSVSFIKRLMQVCGARMYSFMSEAWEAKVTASEVASHGNRRASEIPGREDILMIHSHHIDGSYLGTRYKVTIRRPQGPNFLGPRDDQSLTGASNVGGDIFDLFSQIRNGR